MASYVPFHAATPSLRRADGGLQMLSTWDMLDATYFESHKKSKLLLMDRVYRKGLVGLLALERCLAPIALKARWYRFGRVLNAINMILEVYAYRNIGILKQPCHESMKGSIVIRSPTLARSNFEHVRN
jgi:hypothetical protein